MALGKISIRLRENVAYPYNTKNWLIYLDDVEISQFVRRITIEAEAGMALPNVSMELFGNVELPSELKAYISVEQKEI